MNKIALNIAYFVVKIASIILGTYFVFLFNHTNDVADLSIGFLLLGLALFLLLNFLIAKYTKFYPPDSDDDF